MLLGSEEGKGVVSWRIEEKALPGGRSKPMTPPWLFALTCCISAHTCRML